MPPVFINFSNHPSADWSPAQLAAARKYGEVTDIPFPPVGPALDESGVDELADEFVRRILENGGDNATVHVMGEMTLTFAVVTRLKARGIRCVASTSERIAHEMSDGKKVSEFAFVRFREY